MSKPCGFKSAVKSDLILEELLFFFVAVEVAFAKVLTIVTLSDRE